MPAHDSVREIEAAATVRPARAPALATALGYGLVVGLVVLLASLFGVWTRLGGQLAIFWPANALLLGLLIRFPHLDCAAGWIGAAIGYVLGGHLAGDAWLASALLTLGNFASVVTGYLLVTHLAPQHRRVSTPTSVLHIAWIAAAAATAAGLSGAVIGPVLFGADPMASGADWLVSELVNYIAILPAMLTLPAPRAPQIVRQWRHLRRLPLRRIAPLACLAASLALAVLLGGPGAIAFPVAALLWCAMTYGVFTTAVLTMLYTAWTLAALARGYIDISMRIDTLHALLSIRLGVCLIALTPITLAGAMAANRALLARMRHMAEHDPLTGIMNRRAFTEHAQRQLAAMRAAGRPASLLLLDVDRFKNVNDTHGHGAGDLVLVQIAQRLRDGLAMPSPVLGRMGGEEFAVLLADTDAHTALQTAEQLRHACAHAPVVLEDGRPLTVTLSVGISTHPLAHAPLEDLLKSADQALYAAKHGGRNRVVPAAL